MQSVLLILGPRRRLNNCPVMHILGKFFNLQSIKNRTCSLILLSRKDRPSLYGRLTVQFRTTAASIRPSAAAATATAAAPISLWSWGKSRKTLDIKMAVKSQQKMLIEGWSEREAWHCLAALLCAELNRKCHLAMQKMQFCGRFKTMPVAILTTNNFNGFLQRKLDFFFSYTEWMCWQKA